MCVCAYLWRQTVQEKGQCYCCPLFVILFPWLAYVGFACGYSLDCPISLRNERMLWKCERWARWNLARAGINIYTEWINLFNRPEWSLSYPRWIRECQFVPPVIWGSPNMLEKVAANCVGDILTVARLLALTWTCYRNSLVKLALVLPLFWYRSHLEHSLHILLFISSTKQ